MFRIARHANFSLVRQCISYSIPFLLLIPCGLSAQEFSNWMNVGPGGGGALTSFAVDPFDSDILYVSCDVGGIFRSDDGGDSWKATFASFAENNWGWNNYHQTCFMKPSPHHEGLLVTGGRYAYFVSLDRGESWSRYELPSTITSRPHIGPFCVAYHPIDSNKLIMGRGKNHGNAETALNDGQIIIIDNLNDPGTVRVIDMPDDLEPIHIYCLVPDPRGRSDPNFADVLFASTNRGILRSYNFGDSWYDLYYQPQYQSHPPSGLDYVPHNRIQLMTGGCDTEGNGYLYLTILRHDPDAQSPGEPDDDYARIFRYDVELPQPWIEIAAIDVNYGSSDDGDRHFYHIRCVENNPDNIMAGLHGWCRKDRNYIFTSLDATARNPTFNGWVSANKLAEHDAFHWAGAAFSEACQHLDLYTDQDGYSTAYFGSNSVYMAPSASIWTDPTFYNLTSEYNSPQGNIWEGKGIEPTYISAIAIQNIGGSKITWIGDGDSRIWRSIDPSLAEWECVHNPYDTNSNFWDPWGPNSDLHPNSRGDGCPYILVDGNTVFASSGNRAAAADQSFFQWLNADPYPGTGAILHTENNTANDNWSDFNNSHIAFSDTVQQGIIPRMEILDLGGLKEMHAAVHGNGYWRIYYGAIGGGQWCNFPFQESTEGLYSNYAFAIKCVEYDPPILIGPNQTVVVGCGTYNDWCQKHNNNPIEPGGIWYRVRRSSSLTQAKLNGSTADMRLLDVLCFESIPPANNPSHTELLLAGCWDQKRYVAHGDLYNPYTGIFISADQGKNWTQAQVPGSTPPGFSAKRVTAIRRHPDPNRRLEVYAAVSLVDGYPPSVSYDFEPGIWKSEDGGWTWSRCTTDSQGEKLASHMIMSLEFYDYNTLLVGTMGNGLWKGQLNGSPKILASLVSPEHSIEGFTIKPIGPGRSNHVISFALPNGSRETPIYAAIYSLNGRLVDVLQDGILPAGSHSYRWPMENLSAPPSGVYLCHVRSSNSQLSDRIIHMK